MDSDTAYALFGDRSAGGALRWRGRDYTVRGVFDSPAGTVLLRGGPRSESAYDRVTLDLSGEADPRGAADAFCLRHGLSPEAAVHYGGLRGLGGLLARLPALALALGGLLPLLAAARRSRPEPVLRALWLAGALAALAAALWAMEASFSFPRGLAPTRWSDFDFWKRLWEARREELLAFLWMKKTRPDVLLLARLGKTAAAGLAALVCLAPLGRAAEGGRFALWLAAGPVCALAALLVALRLGVPALPARMFWFSFPLWLAARRLARAGPFPEAEPPPPAGEGTSPA